MHNRHNPDDYRHLVQAAAESSRANADGLRRAQELLQAAEGAEDIRRLEEFEDQLENAPYSTVYEFIGKPRLKKPDQVSSDDLAAELNALFDLLAEHGIAVDFVSDVDDSEVYRFLVENLMVEEVQQLRVPSWTQHFIYEEFFPEKFEDLFLLDDEDLDRDEGNIPF